MKTSTSKQPNSPKGRIIRFRIAAVVLAVLFALALCEAGLRLFMRKQLELPVDERNLLFRHDPELGWFPIPNTRTRFKGSRSIEVVNNDKGFRAPEQHPDNRPGIAFMGDSFVWGYDVEASERFTEKLQARHPEWNIFNFGVSGYGTDQEYLLLQQLFDTYKPRIVFLVFCSETDDDDNSSNVRYGGYYKPYCTVVSNRLTLQGIPVPQCERGWLAEHPFASDYYVARLLARCWFKLTNPPEILHQPPTGPIIRDMQKFVALKSATLLVGLTRTNPPLEQFLTYFKIPFVRLDTNLRYPEFGTHWTPEGHTFVCDRIEQFLRDGNYVDSVPQTALRALPTNSPPEK